MLEGGLLQLRLQLLHYSVRYLIVTGSSITSYRQCRLQLPQWKRLVVFLNKSGSDLKTNPLLCTDTAGRLHSVYKMILQCKTVLPLLEQCPLVMSRDILASYSCYWRAGIPPLGPPNGVPYFTCSCGNIYGVQAPLPRPLLTHAPGTSHPCLHK